MNTQDFNDVKAFIVERLEKQLPQKRITPKHEYAEIMYNAGIARVKEIINELSAEDFSNKRGII